MIELAWFIFYTRRKLVKMPKAPSLDAWQFTLPMKDPFGRYSVSQKTRRIYTDRKPDKYGIDNSRDDSGMFPMTIKGRGSRMTKQHMT